MKFVHCAHPMMDTYVSHTFCILKTSKCEFRGRRVFQDKVDLADFLGVPLEDLQVYYTRINPPCQYWKNWRKED